MMENTKLVLEELKEHLQREVDLKFLDQKDVDRINWYIDTYFKEKERKQLIEAYYAGTAQFDNSALIVNPKTPKEYLSETYITSF